MTNHIGTLVSNYTYNVNAKSLEHCDTEYQTTFSEKMQKIGESMDKAGSKIKGNSSQGRGWEGKSDGANIGGEFGGLDGMEKAADLSGNIGTGLKATVIGAPIGEAYSILGDGMKTIVDYKKGGIDRAVKNGVIRTAMTILGSELTKVIKGVKGVGEITKNGVDLFTDRALDFIKDNLTQEPEKDKSPKK